MRSERRCCGSWPSPGCWWEGYKSDCPDFQQKPIGERWVMPFDELSKRIVDNVRDNVEWIRADPNCAMACKIAVVLPSVVSGACLASEKFLGAVPHPYAKALLIFCEIFSIFKDPLVVGAGLAGAGLGPDWCKETFCHPASGQRQGRDR